MSDLRTLQESMRAALHEGEAVAFLARVAPGGLPAAARLEVYSHMYFSRQAQALADDFPLVQRLAGAPLFERLAVTHVKRRPSSHPSLAHLGRGFEETLRSLDLLAEAAVARLEWARVEAFWAPDAGAVSAAELGALGERLGEAVLELHPSLRLLSLAGGVLEVAAGAGPEALALETAQAAAIWRKGFTVLEAPLTPLEADALGRALAGQTVGAICDTFASAPSPGEAALQALSEWLADGWVCGLHAG